MYFRKITNLIFPLSIHNAGKKHRTEWSDSILRIHHHNLVFHLFCSALIITAYLSLKSRFPLCMDDKFSSVVVILRKFSDLGGQFL